eukprot:TRINITY_DN388_c1_g2_i1.p1 TRINITY_DN388_c1_g2~~TRINITY_DN388_c1_g2_i1.p1  ORF type:complete len:664 (-),score=95.09 TRINITY_DN388_c1_g2_i1:123-2114(-)
MRRGWRLLCQAESFKKWLFTQTNSSCQAEAEEFCRVFNTAHSLFGLAAFIASDTLPRAAQVWPGFSPPLRLQVVLELQRRFGTGASVPNVATISGAIDDAILRNKALDGLNGIPYMPCPYSESLKDLCADNVTRSVRVRAPMASGKTSLLHFLLAQNLGQQVHLVTFTLVPNDKRVLAQFAGGVVWTIEPPILAQPFYRWVADCLQNGDIVLFDELQLLPLEMLAPLVNLANTLGKGKLIAAGLPSIYTGKPTHHKLGWHVEWTLTGLAVPRQTVFQTWAQYVRPDHLNFFLDKTVTPFHESVHVGYLHRLLQNYILVSRQSHRKRKDARLPDPLDVFAATLRECKAETRLGLAVDLWDEETRRLLRHLVKNLDVCPVPKGFANEVVDAAESLGLVWHDRTATPATICFVSKFVETALLFLFGNEDARVATPLFCKSGPNGVIIPDALNAVVLALSLLNWNLFNEIWQHHARSDHAPYEKTLQEEIFACLCRVTTRDMAVFPGKYISKISVDGSGIVDHWIDSGYGLAIEYVVCGASKKQSQKVLTEHLSRFLPETKREANGFPPKSAEYHPGNFRSAVMVVCTTDPKPLLTTAKHWNETFLEDTKTVCALVDVQQDTATLLLPGLSAPPKQLRRETPFVYLADWSEQQLAGSQLEAFRKLPH